MPIKNNGMVSVSIETDGVVYLENAVYENRGAETLSDLRLFSGMWLLDEYESLEVKESDGVGAGKIIDLVKDGNYIYSIGGGVFSVTDVRSNKVVGTLDGFGTLR